MTGTYIASNIPGPIPHSSFSTLLPNVGARHPSQKFLNFVRGGVAMVDYFFHNHCQNLNLNGHGNWYLKIFSPLLKSKVKLHTAKACCATPQLQVTVLVLVLGRHITVPEGTLSRPS